MFLKTKRFLNLVLILMLILGIFRPNISRAEDERVNITILGTSDIHANIFNWSYADGKETENTGLVKVYSVIEQIRATNPNTLLLDNGDTITGTILSDDLYNLNLELKNPVIDVMNFMKYDSMTLGNHEFNYGLDMIKKIEKEAQFPVLAANATYAKDGTYLVKPYIIKEIGGVRVGILGITNPNIPRWDGSIVSDFKFENPLTTVEKHIGKMEIEGVDLIVIVAHIGYKEEYGEDSAEAIIAQFPQVAAVLIGHSHTTEKLKVGNTLVGAPKDAGRQVIKFDFIMEKKDRGWQILASEVDIIDTKGYGPSEQLKAYAKNYHTSTINLLNEVVGKASMDFVPSSEIPGVPEAQIRDTALIDLINHVQLQATGADVSGAALFTPGANLKTGDIKYKDIFEIYRYPNTFVGVQVSGSELKAYMEWSASYYNTFIPGDIHISFNPNALDYNYDMFQGVDYKIDISKPEGKRIMDLKYKGELLKDTDSLKLAINNFKYGVLFGKGIIKGKPYFESAPKSSRSYLADYIKAQTVTQAKTDDNWKVIGMNLNHPLRHYIIEEIKAGKIEIPKSKDGRTVIKSINAEEMIKSGLIPDFILQANGINKIPPITAIKPVAITKRHVVKSGDILWKIAKAYGTTWQEIAKLNKLKNANAIFPNQVLLIP